MAQKIKTNIKFYQGLGDVADKLYGFVTKSNGSWKGCRVTEDKKKIVLVDVSIAKDIVPNMLYSCSLTEMLNGDGFIAKSASMVKFKATISTTYRNNSYLVRVRFGNKIIIYDPASKERRKRNIQSIADAIRQRLDLEDPSQVAEDFINDACMIKRLYEQGKANVCRRNVKQ